MKACFFITTLQMNIAVKQKEHEILELNERQL